MVKTLKSPSHDYGGNESHFWQGQPHQQQQQQQNQTQQQQLPFVIQQQQQQPQQQQQQPQTQIGLKQQLPNFQTSFQQPLGMIQGSGYQQINTGITQGNTHDYIKKQSGSKALYYPPPTSDNYFAQNTTLPPSNYLLTYEKANGIVTDLPTSSVPQEVGTVQQYPQRDNYRGNYQFQLMFPNESTKLVVTPACESDGNRYMYTTNGSSFTAFMAHTAGQSAVVRFFLVYSNEAETTTPVHPCKNHQITDHPKHLLTVRGSGDAKYEEDHHPSVVVTPTPTGETVGNFSCSKYCVQIEFLCRNSCLTRKDLILVCQLEENGIVYGRECLELKVSACPRRDARAKDKIKTKGRAFTPSNTKNPCLPSPHPVKRSADTAFETQGGAMFNCGGDFERFGLLCYMEKRFKQMHPDEHLEAKQQFQSWWAAKRITFDDI